jgi:hypothetical protein
MTGLKAVMETIPGPVGGGGGTITGLASATPVTITRTAVITAKRKNLALGME